MGGNAFDTTWQLGRTAEEISAIEAEAKTAGKTAAEVAATKPAPVAGTVVVPGNLFPAVGGNPGCGPVAAVEVVTGPPATPALTAEKVI